jgi:hypothetical protein
MYHVLILVCSVAFSPGDCQRNNAREVIIGPEAQNEVMCAFYGQAYLANTSIGALHHGEYVKVQCARSSIGKTVGWLRLPAGAMPTVAVSPAG